MSATSESGTDINAQDENPSPNKMPLDRDFPGPVVKGVLVRSEQGPRIPVSHNSLPQISTLPNRSENLHPGPELHSGYRCCSTTFSHLHYSFHVTISGAPVPCHIDGVEPTGVSHSFV